MCPAIVISVFFKCSGMCLIMATMLDLLQVYRRAGLAGCYAGLGPTLARAFPANAAAIVAWEYSAKILGLRRD
jgi:hypothetical protein